MSRHFFDNNSMLTLETIYASIDREGFSRPAIGCIDNYTNSILNGKTNLTQFNQAEHAGLCCAGEVLIGAYIVCHYARTSLETGADVGTSQAGIPNWEIDLEQEKMVQQWAEAKHLWFANAEADIVSENKDPIHSLGRS